VDLLRSAPGPLDVVLEAKAKDLALLHARAALERLFPDLAALEERTGATTAVPSATGVPDAVVTPPAGP
jgi:hypothetical protein